VPGIPIGALIVYRARDVNWRAVIAGAFPAARITTKKPCVRVEFAGTLAPPEIWAFVTFSASETVINRRFPAKLASRMG
jgi:hypothetical protein